MALLIGRPIESRQQVLAEVPGSSSSRPPFRRAVFDDPCIRRKGSPEGDLLDRLEAAHENDATRARPQPRAAK